MRRFARCIATLALPAAVLACGEPARGDEHVLRERQKFEVRLLSWAPLASGRVAVDVEISVAGRSDLDQLTVEVQQVDGEQSLMRVDPATLDVSGMDYDAKRLATLEVDGAGEGVQAVAVVLENLPDAARRAAWPEFQEP